MAVQWLRLKLARPRKHMPPDVRVKVTIQRLHGPTVLSEAVGKGGDLTEALWNARNRTKSLYREIGDLLAATVHEQEDST